MEASTLAVASVAGVLSHLAYFKIGEHHMHGIRYIFAAIASLAVSTIVETYLFHLPSQTAILNTLTIAGSYLSGLYTSLIIFRVFFHPLGAFPGPFGCKISCFWFTTQLARRDAFRQLYKLHQKQGNFIRIGSNDLSISHPKAVQAIYGLGSKCFKSDSYDLTRPLVSLQSTRDDNLHSERRRIWSAAFGNRNIGDYVERMVQSRELLVKAIEDSYGGPIDVTKWFSLYGFDTMGELAFGRSFGMLETGKEHEAVKLLHSGFFAFSFKFPCWFFRILIGIPGAGKNWQVFTNYCTSQLDNRIQAKEDTKDIMSCLLKPLNGRIPTGLDRSMLEGDAQLAIVAGSDTLTTALTTVFRYLAQYPHHVALLRAEIDDLPRNELGDYTYTDLTSLNHLNGVINEALRLFPPVPTTLTRLTPPEGLEIGGTFIPGNTTVTCPQFVIGRSSKCYGSPDDFIPERWYSQPELIRDTTCFAPFSAGSYGCVGQPLAMVNLRETISRIIADYDVHSAASGNLAAYDEEMKEHFTLEPPKLELCFTRRQRCI